MNEVVKASLSRPVIVFGMMGAEAEFKKLLGENGYVYTVTTDE